MRTRVETGSGYELLGAALDVVIGAATGEESPVATGLDLDATSVLIGAGREPLINAVGFLAGGARGPSSSDLIEGLRALDPADRLRVFVGYYRRSVRRATDPEVMDRAIAGDPAARDQFLASSFPEIGHWQQSLALFLAADGAAQAERLVDALAALAALAAASPDVSAAPDVEREAERARQLIASIPVDLAIERLTGTAGITFARAIGQEDVVVSPRASGKRIFAVSDYGSTLVVSYPTDDSTEELPPGWLVALGRALGDERRLRILRALAAEPLAIVELGPRLGIPRTSLQYHLAILREAGLIGWAVDDAESGPLTLRRSGLDDIGPGLSRYLGLGDGR